MNTLHALTQENKQCIVRAAQIIGDTWSLLIIAELLNGSKRFGELQEALDKISPQTLSARLKTMEKFGFVVRHAYAEIPPRVEYELTERGLATSQIIGALADFGDKYMSGPPFTDCDDELP